MEAIYGNEYYCTYLSTVATDISFSFMSFNIGRFINIIKIKTIFLKNNKFEKVLNMACWGVDRVNDNEDGVLDVLVNGGVGETLVKV